MRQNIRFINSSSHIKLCEFNWSYNEVTHSESLHRGYLVVPLFSGSIIMESLFCTLWRQTVFFNSVWSQTAIQIAGNTWKHHWRHCGDFSFFLLGTKHKHKVHLIDAGVDGRSVPLMDAVCLSVGFISSIHLRESTQKPFETGEALQKKKKM